MFSCKYQGFTGSDGVPSRLGPVKGANGGKIKHIGESTPIDQQPRYVLIESGPGLGESGMFPTSCKATEGGRLRKLNQTRLAALYLLENALSLARDLAHSWPRGPHQYYLCATPPSPLVPTRLPLVCMPFIVA
jgi:hypothetical protein